MKFVIYTDYKAAAGEYDYKAIEAADLAEAIEIADSMWNEDVYLMRIMKKVGKVVKPYKAGYAFETYEAILCKRGTGWHRNTPENSEAPHRVNKNWLTNNKAEVWFETE